MGLNKIIKNLDKIQGQQIEIKQFSIEFSNLSMIILCNNCNFQVIIQNFSNLCIQNCSFPFIIQGVEIIDNIVKGWESDCRYMFHDYEDENISFYCQEIKIIKI